MMNQFFVRYIPGGMSLNHSAWWLFEVNAKGYEVPVKKLFNATY
jgi:hypothetical protein